MSKQNPRAVPRGVSLGYGKFINGQGLTGTAKKEEQIT